MIHYFHKVKHFFLVSQFVPFRDYMDRTGNHVLSMARLAKDVLAEIPDQLISYMKSRGIKPNLVPQIYLPGDHPQTNPVWVPHTVCVGAGRHWWEPASTNHPLRGKWEWGPFVNINPAKQKDDDSILVWRTKTALGEPADVRGVFPSERLRMRAPRAACCKRRF